jgi:hypothetical protein
LQLRNHCWRVLGHFCLPHLRRSSSRWVALIFVRPSVALSASSQLFRSTGRWTSREFGTP